MAEINDLIHSINVYYLENKFYLVALVRMPPVGLRTEVFPPYISLVNDKKSLANNIEKVGLTSNVSSNAFLKEATSIRLKPWDGENKRIWKTASQKWTIDWYEDGTIGITKKKLSKVTRDGASWRQDHDGEKFFSPPVSSSNIAQEILNQL